MTKKITIGKSVLETITVALYENPIILFREYVQNSLDAYNKAKDDGNSTIRDFHVSIHIDEQNKNIVVKDNGYGIVTFELFKERMLSIGSSHKAADKTRYIGFRGIGRISGLPFCSKLIFRNKVANSNKVYECVWDGEKYRKILDEGADGDLESIINKIVTIEESPADSNTKIEHYFEVTLEQFSDDIKEMMADAGFKDKLIRMLPLEYKKDFKGSKKIISRYNDFMKTEDLKRFMIPVKFNGEELYKCYDDTFILDSDLVFWELRGKQKGDGSQGDKIGLLWFTFEGHLKSRENDEYYGILTRSKNVLFGGNDTFAQIADANKQYVTTFRELAQALRGIYGELLINSQYLSDNSRRDWFLPDEHSRDLNNVITDFMRRLHQYRYCASRYFRQNATKTKEELKHALDELVDLKTNRIDYDKFSEKGKEAKERKIPADGSFAEEDIPHKSQGMKNCYDILMKVIEAYFKKIKQRSLFWKLRAFIVSHFENE
jgi:hypothetical protein